MRYLLATGLMLTALAPAWAVDEYYIVRGRDKKCEVVGERPTTTTVTVVGNTVYPTRAEAEAVIEIVCSIEEDDEDTD